MSTWLELINEASAKGYRVSFSDEHEGWIITTPKRPRRPSEELGSYKDESAAWRGAALINSLD
jgi:hypothetical protein